MFKLLKEYQRSGQIVGILAFSDVGQKRRRPSWNKYIWRKNEGNG